MSPKTPSPMIATLLILGGTVFGVLGALHAVYTLLDLHNPRRRPLALAPLSRLTRTSGPSSVAQPRRSWTATSSFVSGVGYFRLLVFEPTG